MKEERKEGRGVRVSIGRLREGSAGIPILVQVPVLAEVNRGGKVVSVP